MRSIVLRAAIALIATMVAAAANAETFYGYCTDSEHSNVVSPIWTYEGASGDYDEIVEQWEQAVSTALSVETYKVRGTCYAATDRSKTETRYNNFLSYTDEYPIQFAPTSSQPVLARKEAESDDTGILCEAGFHADSHTYYEKAGTDFSYGVWIPAVPAKEIPKYEAFLLEHYEKLVAAANVKPDIYPLGYASFRGVECVPLRLAGEMKRATSWGKTSRQVDAAIADHFARTHWYLDDTVKFDELNNAKSKSLAKQREDSEKQSEASAEPKKSAAQLAAEAAAERKAKYEAEFQAKQAEYERKLAEQQKQVEDFKRAQEEVERTKAANQAKADEAAAKFKAEQEAYAETLRRNEERQEAAKKLMADWDARHGLKAKASTDTDANQCVTQAETQLNATFKGNTAASIINGCGQPIDVRICLMTSTKGWNCGVGYGVGSQEKWSHSSFDATGPVFVDARISSSSRPLAHPQ